ncbi:MAG: gliding motility-associated C-terminal domain-containing protein [Crocinitomicaceae bacterium]
MCFWQFTIVNAQAIYNGCANALEICPNTIYNVNNIDADITFCGGCEDNFNFCFTTENTIWITFTTNNAGGDVQVNFSNLVFEANANQGTALQATIIEATAFCSSGSYTQLGNCVSNAAGNFTLNATGLLPTTTYFIVVDGDNTGAGVTSAAESTFDISILGTGVDRVVPSAQITPTNLSFCQNEVIYLGVDLQNCPDSSNISWYVNGTLEAVTSDTVLIISSLQDGDVVTVEASCFTQCMVVVSSSTNPVSVYTFPIDAGQDQTIYIGGQAQLNGSTSAPDYYWTPSFFVSDTSDISPMANPTSTITYTLTAAENGCTSTDYVTITVIDDLDIPNTISPNGDNINDKWFIEGIENYPNSILYIYDRWGQEVFQTTGYSKTKAWDGTIKIRESAEGVYFYVLDLELDKGETYKGSITVVR